MRTPAELPSTVSTAALDPSRANAPRQNLSSWSLFSPKGAVGLAAQSFSSASDSAISRIAVSVSQESWKPYGEAPMLSRISPYTSSRALSKRRSSSVSSFTALSDGITKVLDSFKSKPIVLKNLQISGMLAFAEIVVEHYQVKHTVLTG